MEADDPQGGDTDFQHIVGGVEEAQKKVGDQLEEGHAGGHDGGGVDHAQPDRFDHPLRLPCAEVVGHDGDQTVVHAEYRHEHEALELEVPPEHGGRRGGEADEDLVHPEGHHRADGGHDDGGHAHRVDAADDLSAGAEAPEAQSDLRVLPCVEVDAQGRAHHLAQHRGPGRAGNAHVEYEDEDWVEDDVDDRAHHLGNHAVDGLSGGLEQALDADGGEDAEGADGTDADIRRAALHDVRHIRLDQKEGPGEQGSQHREGQRAAQAQKYAVGGRQIGPLKPLFAKTFAEEGVDAHAGTCCHRNHQVLHREGQAHRVQRVLADPGDEDAVHHIVQSLDQHTEHDGHRDVHQQLVDGQDAHFVLLRSDLFFFHSLLIPFQGSASLTCSMPRRRSLTRRKCQKSAALARGGSQAALLW